MATNTANEVIAHSLRSSKGLLHRYTEDLKPEEYLHRTTAKANCVAWLIGHLTLTDRRVLERFGVPDDALPKLPEGFTKRFSRDEGCPQAADFGDVSILLPLFDSHRDLLIRTIERATAEQLNKPLEKAMPMFSTPGELASFMSLHTAMHAGQITMIRRSLGKPPVV
jgi:uncharacterized damage-inducible protein DinB